MVKKCPYCSGDLLHGFIKTNEEVLTWSPNPKRKSIFSHCWRVKEDEIKLGIYGF